MDAPAFGYVSGEGFEPHLHNEGGSDGSIIDGVRQEDESEYEPDEITIIIPFTSTTSLDSQSYYWLPEDEIDAANNGVAFLGIGLEELDPDDWDGNVTISLSGVTGMGDFLLWRSGAFGDPETVLDSSNLGLSFELAPGRSHPLQLGIHGGRPVWTRFHHRRDSQDRWLSDRDRDVQL